MALLDTSLLFQGSVVRFRATAAEGVKIRALLSSVGPPLRLEIEDGRDEENEKEAVPLMASILAGKDKETPMVSISVPLFLQSCGVASLRLDNLLSKLIGEVAMSSEFALLSISDGSPIPLPVFRVSIHFAASRANTANRVHPINTVTIRAEGIDFPFTRELLCLHSEFFCALLYGSFREAGKGVVELDTFTIEDINLLYRMIQLGYPVEQKMVLAALDVADRILSPSLMAQISAVPIPNDEAIRAEWLLIADQYNNMNFAAVSVHLDLFDEISNKEVHRLLLMRAAGKLPDLDAYIVADMGDLGTVRIRLFTYEEPEVAELMFKSLPLTTEWRESNGYVLAFSEELWDCELKILWSSTSGATLR